LQIRIPIVKPPGWEEVQPLVHQMPVTFDERGIKETMTVKSHRWSQFVDSQRAKLRRELEELRLRQEQLDEEDPDAVDEDGDSFPDGSWQTPEQEEHTHREDVRELEQMVERMEDWKDLCRYSGKSISMASTRRGNEMKIHVLAFAEREDGAGVDFMRMDYRKSVEVQKQMGSSGGVIQTLRAILPFVREPRMDPDAREKQWVDLLRRPDVAKFAIALAFRNALESDGVVLEIHDGAIADGVA
jgi:hypothetical protein